MRPSTFLAIPALAAALAAGCSGGPTLGKVTGTVTLDDKALPKGTITFETAGQRPATARVENGQIVEATTYKAGDGVPVGSHTLSISAFDDAASAVADDPGKGKAPGSNYMTGKSLVPARYNDPSTSGLTAVIKPGSNPLELKLTSK
jgi:hypothetical protein